MQLSNAPAKLVLPFANAGGKNTIPVASQIGVTPGAASFTDGFPPLTRTPIVSGGVPPSGLDMNGIMFDFSAVLRWANAGGSFVYDSTFATDANVGGYPKGATLLRADGLGFWLNTADNNTTDPEAAGTGWVPGFTSGATAVTMTNANVTLTAPQYGKPIIIITGALVANLNLIFPTIVGEWVVANRTTGAFSVTAKTAAGTGVVLTQGQSTLVHTDSVNLSQVGSPVINTVQGFRLTLTSGLPVTTSDVTGAGTIYACPYVGNQISLYSSGAWSTYGSAQFSLALSGLTSGRPYDLFAYASSGMPALEALAWTNDTTRATALAYQDGVLVKSTDATRRYMGTFYTTGTATTEDSQLNRYLWNYYNRTTRPTSRYETASTWNYSLAAWRQANANSANQINFVIGVSEDAVIARTNGSGTNSTTSGRAVRNGIGLDTTTANYAMEGFGVVTSGTFGNLISMFNQIVAPGRHYLAWLEAGDGNADVQTFYGTSSIALSHGIQAEVRG